MSPERIGSPRKIVYFGSREGAAMYGDENKTQPGWEPPEQGNTWKNIGKVLFLVITLVAAWFLLQWLIEGK
jgi:hypothetical protein